MSRSDFLILDKHFQRLVAYMRLGRRLENCPGSLVNDHPRGFDGKKIVQDTPVRGTRTLALFKSNTQEARLALKN